MRYMRRTYGVHYNVVLSTNSPDLRLPRPSVRKGEAVCQRVPGAIIIRSSDCTLLLELIQPITLEVAFAVQQEVEARITETDTLRRKHVERAQYDAELARRRS